MSEETSKEEAQEETAQKVSVINQDTQNFLQQSPTWIYY